MGEGGRETRFQRISIPQQWFVTPVSGEGRHQVSGGVDTPKGFDTYERDTGVTATDPLDPMPGSAKTVQAFVADSVSFRKDSRRPVRVRHRKSVAEKNVPLAAESVSIINVILHWMIRGGQCGSVVGNQ